MALGRPLTPESNNGESANNDRAHLGAWLAENVWTPAYDAGVVEPVNALASTLNAGGHLFGKHDVLPLLDKKPVNVAEVGSPEWFAQTFSAGVSGLVPYVVAGKVAGAGLRTVAPFTGAAELSSFLARDSMGLVAGAALYDGMRVPGVGETRLGNAIGGATAFGVFGIGNKLSRPLPLADKLIARGLVGSTGAVMQTSISDLISQRTLSTTRNLDDAVATGAFMNLALPMVQRVFHGSEAVRVEAPERTASAEVRMRTEPLHPPRPAQQSENSSLYNTFALSDMGRAASGTERSAWLRSKWIEFKKLPTDSLSDLEIRAKTDFNLEDLGRRFTSVEVKPHAIEQRTDVQGPFADYSDFIKRAVQNVEVPTRTYTIKGHDTRVLVPETYAAQLDEVRDLRLKVSRTAEGSAERSAARSELDKHALKDRILPEELIPLLDELPDSRYFEKLLLSGEANPEDDWVKQTFSPTFVSSMATDPQKNLLLFKTKNDQFLRTDVFHEWGHRLAGAYPTDYERFEDAAELEYRAWQYVPRDYALRNHGEHFAVLGEEITKPELRTFLTVGQKAPLRTLIFLNALGKSLANAANEGRPSSSLDAFTKRVDFARNSIANNAFVDLNDFLLGTSEIAHQRVDNVRSYLANEGLQDPFFNRTEQVASGSNQSGN